MRCPFCTSPDTQVLETRDAADALRRRRRCAACDRRFTTYERVEALALCVVKRDGRREPFDRDKLMRGLVRAAAKRPVAVGQLEAVADAVADRLRVSGGELGSADVGALVLGELRDLDPVAAVRFASVYRRFESAEEFAAELARLSVRPGADDAQLPPDSPGLSAESLQSAAHREENGDGQPRADRPRPRRHRG